MGYEVGTTLGPNDDHHQREHLRPSKVPTTVPSTGSATLDALREDIANIHTCLNVVNQRLERLEDVLAIHKIDTKY